MRDNASVTSFDAASNDGGGGGGGYRDRKIDATPPHVRASRASLDHCSSSQAAAIRSIVSSVMKSHHNANASQDTTSSSTVLPLAQQQQQEQQQQPRAIPSSSSARSDAVPRMSEHLTSLGWSGMVNPPRVTASVYSSATAAPRFATPLEVAGRKLRFGYQPHARKAEVSTASAPKMPRNGTACLASPTSDVGSVSALSSPPLLSPRAPSTNDVSPHSLASQRSAGVAVSDWQRERDTDALRLAYARSLASWPGSDAHSSYYSSSPLQPGTTPSSLLRYQQQLLLLQEQATASSTASSAGSSPRMMAAASPTAVTAGRRHVMYQWQQAATPGLSPHARSERLLDSSYQSDAQREQQHRQLSETAGYSQSFPLRFTHNRLAGLYGKRVAHDTCRETSASGDEQHSPHFKREAHHALDTEL